MHSNFIYCIGACISKRKFSCKRWLGHYSEKKHCNRIDGTQCDTVKGQMSFEDRDYFIKKD